MRLNKMIALIKRLLAPPVFDGREATRTAAILNTILLTLLPLTLLLSITPFFTAPTQTPGLSIDPFLLIFELSLLFLMRRIPVRLVSLLFTTGIWITIIGVDIFRFGGLDAINLGGYMGVVLIGGLLLGSRGGFAFAGLSIISTVVTFHAKRQGLLPSLPQSTDTADLVLTFCAFYVFAAVILYLTVENINQALARARRNEQALAESNRRLQDEISERQKMESERVRLLVAEREQRLLAETLAEVTLALTSQTDHTAVLDEILHQAHRLVPYKTANIMTLKNDTLRTAHRRGHKTADQALFISNLEHPLTHSPTDAKIAQTREPVIIPDTSQEPEWIWVEETSWIQSYLGIPLCHQDKIVGLLRLNGDTPGQFSEEDAQRLMPLAHAAVIALENARLLETVRQRAIKLEAAAKENARLYEHAQQEISERKRVEKELQIAHDELAMRIKELVIANEELEQFTYIMSHDLRTPLRGIVRLSEWLEEDLHATLTKETRYHMQQLRRRVHRLEAMIEGIMRYLRTKSTPFETERVDVREMLKQLRDLLAPPSGFLIKMEGEMPTFITARLPLKQVFSNLISNAIKHHDQGRGQVTISARDLGAFYEFVVADDGPGIAPQFHRKIFVILQTLRSKDETESSGIGLALVKKIVENQGGTITLESAAGQGATFRFTWPKKIDSQDREGGR